MYKLLLVTDQEDVLKAFSEVEDWSYLGFHQPHIRRDLEGAKDGLRKHHVDGIAVALSEESENSLIEFLREEYPLLPIVEAGRTQEEIREYMGGFRRLLNHLKADFSSAGKDEGEMLIRARHHFFRSLAGGSRMPRRQMAREIRLLRSRMDPNMPCFFFRLEQTAKEEDRLVGRWQDSDHLLERELYQSFGGDVDGMHVLPLVTLKGDIWVVCGCLRGEKQPADISERMDEAIQAGLRHAEEYRGLHLRVAEKQEYPSFFALASD